MKTPTDQLLPRLASWDLKDLRELQGALAGLIEALEVKPAETLTQEDNLDMKLPEKSTQRQASGHIEAKYIPRGKKKHGPYLYLRYWQGGKLRSKYLGKPK